MVTERDFSDIFPRKESTVFFAKENQGNNGTSYLLSKVFFGLNKIADNYPSL